MNNLSSTFTIDDLREIAYRGSYGDSERALARELLALREAGKEPDGTLINEGTIFKPVADLYEMQFVDGSTMAFHTDAAKAAQWLNTCYGNKVQEYVTLERFQQSYAAPQLPAVPEGAEERLAAAVELLKQAAPHMLADESLKDPDGALCGKRRAVPDGEMLRRWLAFGRAMEKSGSTLPRHLIAETEAMIAAAPKPEVDSNWIKCSDRMPEENNYDVWTYSPSKGVNHSYGYDGYGRSFCDEENYHNIDDVTHWMPINNPLPPKPSGDNG